MFIEIFVILFYILSEYFSKKLEILNYNIDE